MTKRMMMVLGMLALFLCDPVLAADKLAKKFAAPPVESRAWCLWWWMNGAALRPPGWTKPLAR